MHKLHYKARHKKEGTYTCGINSERKIQQVIKLKPENIFGLDYIKKIVIKMTYGKVDYAQCSYQYKINLTASTLYFPGIGKLEPYSMVTEPSIGIIYLNNHKKKSFMGALDISKFCDWTLKKVLDKVTKIYRENEFGFLKPSLSENDKEVMKLMKDGIGKRLKHQ
ncbi:hypothetical protein Tco_1411530 [Tanacetum coccineum]